MDTAHAQPATEDSRRIDDSVEATSERIERSWRGLMDALAGIPEERLTEPGVVGDWSVKDLLGHVAVWDAHAVAAVRRYLAGEAPDQVDWEAINEREAAARAGRSVPEQRSEMEAAHEQVCSLVRGLRPPDLAALGVRHSIAVDTHEHYDEHAAEIRAWRERLGI